MRMSAYLRDRLLAAVFNGRPYVLSDDPWISLHAGDPGLDGAHELTGGTYQRAQASFTEARNGVVATIGDVDFERGLPAAQVTHIGLWAAREAGHPLYVAELDEPQTLNRGGAFRVPAGDLDVTQD